MPIEGPEPVPDGGGVVLLDTGCGFCMRTRRWIERHAPEGRFVFHDLASPTARRWLDAAGWHGPPPDAVVLIEKERFALRSTAVLRIIARMRAPRRWLSVFRVVPTPLRDWGYGVVSRHRHRL